MASFDDVFNEPRRGPSMQEMMELRLAYGRLPSSSGALQAAELRRLMEQSVVQLAEDQAAEIRDRIRATPPTTTPRNQERSNPMNARAKKLLSFMLEAPDGKYDAPKPTDEQLAAVLPWLVDQSVTWGRDNGYGSAVLSLLGHFIGGGRYGLEQSFDAAGIDTSGYDREGFNVEGFSRSTGRDREGYDFRGYDQNGLNRDGFNRYGYDKDGFNKDGLNQYSKTRAEAVVELVGGWSKEHLAAVYAKLAEREAKADAEAAAKAAEEQATTAADATITEGVEPAPVANPLTTLTRDVFDDLVADNSEDDEDEDKAPAAVTLIDVG